MASCPTQVLSSDAELIAKIRAGDASSYAVLVQRYERLVRAAVFQRLSDRHLAEDVAQDTFLIAFQSLSLLRKNGSFGAWLLGIARNQALRAVRVAARCEAGTANLDALTGERARGLSPESSSLLEHVENLPEHERVVIGLKHFDGHSVAEIAEITGRPSGTITKQLSRAYARLAEWLIKEAKR